MDRGRLGPRYASQTGRHHDTDMFMEQGMTFRERKIFEDDWWGRGSGLAPEVCELYVLRAVYF